MRRRDRGYTSVAELHAALAPFDRPSALTPWDLPKTFEIETTYVGSLSFSSITFVPGVRAKLLGHLGIGIEQADQLLERLIEDLRRAFDEQHGFATRYTHPQLVAALLALLRWNPSVAIPPLPQAFLRAIQSNERLPARNNHLPDDLPPLPYDPYTLMPLQPWTELGADEVVRRAEALYRAVRQRSPDNWEKLARKAKWEPLRQGTIESCARMWVKSLGRPASASKPLLAFTLELLRLVDPTHPRPQDADLIESVRTRLATALKKLRAD
jgi:hypothetical protein